MTKFEKEKSFITELQTKILKDVAADPSKNVAIMVIPGSFNPIHKGHLAMFDKAYKELISNNENTLIYGVYVVAEDEWVNVKITKAKDPPITAISSTDRIKLCSDAFSDYYTDNPTYKDKLFVYPVAKETGTVVIDKIMITIINHIHLNKIPYDENLITDYIVCGSDHIYNSADPTIGAYLWGYNVIAIVRKDDVEKIKIAQNTKTQISFVGYTLSERWTKIGDGIKDTKTIWFIQPEADEIDAEMSSSEVRKYLKEGTVSTACETSKKKLHELLTDTVYGWVMTNLMEVIHPTCKDAVEAAPVIETPEPVKVLTPKVLIPAPAAKTEAPAIDAEAEAEAVIEAVSAIEAESVEVKIEPVLVPINYFISIHFKPDEWTFYRCLMRGYLISTYIASYVEDEDDESKNIKTQIRRAMYNSTETVMHADNVFHFDDVIISEYDAIIGMLTRMSRWFKFKLDQSVPRKPFSSVEDGSALMSTADYFVHQLDAAFKVVDTGSEQSTMNINDFMDDLTADIDNANSSKVLAAWDATRRVAAATRRAPAAAWTATKSAASSVADAVSGMALRVNTTRKKVSASLDKSIADRTESFAARRRAVADASAADAKAGGGRQVARQQMKQTGGAYKNAEAFAGMMTKLKQYVGDDGAPANKPAMLADEYFERLSKIVAGVSRPSIFGHPLLLYLPFARAFNCVIYVYKPSQSDTDNYILKYIFRGVEAEVEEVEGEEEGEEEARTKEVHEIHILDKNPDDSAFLDDVGGYSSRFALLVLSGTSGTVVGTSSTSGSTAGSSAVASSTGVVVSAVAPAAIVPAAIAHAAIAPDFKVKSYLPALPVPVSTAICGEDKEITEECQNAIFKLDTTGNLSKYLSVIGTKYESTRTAIVNRDVVPSGSATIIKLAEYSSIEYSSPEIAANVKFILQAATGSMRSNPTNDDLATYGSDALINTVFNCLYLANKNGVDGIIFPMIGGSIFVDRIYITDPTSRRKITLDEIVERLMMGAVQFLTKYTDSSIKKIGFCAFGDAAMKLKFVEKYNSVVARSLQDKIVYIPMDDANDYFKVATKALNTSNNAALVNAANTELEFGTGISGAFKKFLNVMKPGVSKTINGEGKNFKELFHDAYSTYLKQAPAKSAKSVAKPVPPVVAKPAPPKVDPKSIRVMTFNTCWEALGAKASGTLDMTHCGESPNKCRSNINAVIKKSIDDNYDFILLQEMTSDFDTDLVGIATITRNIALSDFKTVFEYEFANELYTGYGYKFCLYPSNMGILSLKKADTVVVGNLSAIPYDRKPVIYGGSRPFMILVFKADNRIVMNVHAPQPSKFMQDVKQNIDYKSAEILKIIEDAATSTPSKISQSDIANKTAISNYRTMQEYAFNYVIPNAIQTKLGLSIEEMKTYQFIIAGDFNSINPILNLNGLYLKIPDTTGYVSGLPRYLSDYPGPKGNALNGTTYITCAFPNTTKLLTDYKNGALSDHILSNMKMETGSYKIFDGKIDGVDIPGILAVPPEFSDHLPVYATITSEKE